MRAVPTANDTAKLILERRMRRPDHEPDPNKGLTHPPVDVVGVRTIHNGVHRLVKPTAFLVSTHSVLAL